MSHTFLLEPGRWILKGTWLERNAMPMPVQGRILVSWSSDRWFTMITKLTYPHSDRTDSTLTYKGRLDADERRFTFLLNHSDLGKSEGEGWVGPGSIIQRYWVMDDKQLRTGFQTLYKQDDDCYHLSGAIVARQNLDSTMEAVLTSHFDPK